MRTPFPCVSFVVLLLGEPVDLVTVFTVLVPVVQDLFIWFEPPEREEAISCIYNDASVAGTSALSGCGG